MALNSNEHLLHIGVNELKMAVVFLFDETAMRVSKVFTICIIKIFGLLVLSYARLGSL